MKKQNLHRNRHPIHWHSTMFVAVAAILLTSLKCSSDMMRALHAVPTPSPIMDSVIMRDDETEHSPIILTVGIKQASAGGK